MDCAETAQNRSRRAAPRLQAPECTTREKQPVPDGTKPPFLQAQIPKPPNPKSTNIYCFKFHDGLQLRLNPIESMPRRQFKYKKMCASESHGTGRVIASGIEPGNGITRCRAGAPKAIGLQPDESSNVTRHHPNPVKRRLHKRCETRIGAVQRIAIGTVVDTRSFAKFRIGAKSGMAVELFDGPAQCHCINAEPSLSGTQIMPSESAVVPPMTGSFSITVTVRPA